VHATASSAPGSPAVADPETDGAPLLGGRFEVIAYAAAGGMGSIYRGMDRVTGNPVALKMARYSDDDSRTRFSRESDLLSRMGHPGIVRYVTAGTLGDDGAWLATEWLDGETLMARLRRGALSIDDSILLGIRLGEALGQAHAVGIVHRDIKPSNIFLVDARVD